MRTYESKKKIDLQVEFFKPCPLFILQKSMLISPHTFLVNGFSSVIAVHYFVTTLSIVKV